MVGNAEWASGGSEPLIDDPKLNVNSPTATKREKLLSLPKGEIQTHKGTIRANPKERPREQRKESTLPARHHDHPVTQSNHTQTR